MEEVWLLLLCILLAPSGLAIEGQQPGVDVSIVFYWKCPDATGRKQRRGAVLTDGCYRYTCTKVRGWDVRWEAETLPSCCGKGSRAFPNGTMMADNMEDAGCLRRQEECVVEDGRAMVVRTLTKLCCGPREGQKEFVQWFHFQETSSGRLLDLVDGSLHLAKRDGKRDQQKWRIKDKRLLNKEHPNKAIGMKGGLLVLLDSADKAVLSIAFEHGSLQDLSSGLQLAASTDGQIGEFHQVAKRQVLIPGTIPTGPGAAGAWQQTKASPVGCPELGSNYPPFPDFTNIEADTGCWGDIEPTFRLYTKLGMTEITVDSTSLQVSGVSAKDIKHLVVVIHGYGANADPDNDDDDQWPHEMAELILNHDTTPGLAVLTVDWEKGANPDIPGLDLGRNYNQAAANTRYVGVATERVVKQLTAAAGTSSTETAEACRVEGGHCGDPSSCSGTVLDHKCPGGEDNKCCVEKKPDVYIHCIGHSLGAHTCGFFGNAVEEDKSYSKAKVDRITAMDPAGPSFTSKLTLTGAADPIDGLRPLDERLDSSDASLVDAIHTDSDHLGIVPSVGNTDFYVGKSPDHLGADQAGCITPVCDHGRSHELMRASISQENRCWAHFPCTGETGRQGCTSTLRYMTPRPHFGYWYTGGAKGDYGVVLEEENTPMYCLECLDDIACKIGEKCDIASHTCKPEPTNNPNQCPNGRRKKRQAEATCSSETAEACKIEGGYCGNPNSCRSNGGTVLDNKCPSGQENKCCVGGLPYQEDECQEAGGHCSDRCSCEDSLLHNLCPSQPNTVKCCPTTDQTEPPCEEEPAVDCSQLTCRTGLSSSSRNGVYTLKCGGKVLCSDLKCPRGLSTSCSNGDCKVDCKGGSNTGSAGAAAGGAGSGGAGAGGAGAAAGGAGTGGAGAGGAGAGTAGTDAGDGGAEGAVAGGAGGVGGSLSGGNNNNNNNNNNGRGGGSSSSGGGGNNNNNNNNNG